MVDHAVNMKHEFTTTWSGPGFLLYKPINIQYTTNSPGYQLFLNKKWNCDFFKDNASWVS